MHIFTWTLWKTCFRWRFSTRFNDNSVGTYFLGHHVQWPTMVRVYNRLREIRWVYLIKGVTETAGCKNLAPARIQTKARQRIEMKLEVTLTGSVPGPKQVMRCRRASEQPQQVIITEGIASVFQQFRFCLFATKSQKKLFQRRILGVGQAAPGSHKKNDFLFLAVRCSVVFN